MRQCVLGRIALSPVRCDLLIVSRALLSVVIIVLLSRVQWTPFERECLLIHLYCFLLSVLIMDTTTSADKKKLLQCLLDAVKQV